MAFRGVHKRTIIFWIFWVFLHASVFIGGWYKQAADPQLKFLNQLRLSVWSSRGAGLALSMDGALLLLPMCRNLMAVLREIKFLNKIIPFDDAIFLHKMTAWSMLIFTLIHVNAHYVNFTKVEYDLKLLPAWVVHYTTWAGITGHIMLLCMFLMYTTAAVAIRRKSFEAFWYVHHLAVIFYFCFIFHAYGCFVKTDGFWLKRGRWECRPYYSWWPAVGVCGLYFCERLLRVYRSYQPTQLSKAILHPSNALELQIIKPSMTYKPGQWIFINVPEVAWAQWHPFTISSTPEEPYVSVHIRIVGDWTKKLAARLGASSGNNSGKPITLDRHALPKICIDGPFGAPAEDAFDYEVCTLVSCGIGVTPFLSILKSIYYKQQNNLPMKIKKVHFVWVNRDKQAFRWLKEELDILESQIPQHLMEFHLYLTEKLDLKTINNIVVNDVGGKVDPITNLYTRLNYGRPNWGGVVRSMGEDAIKNYGRDDGAVNVGVFFCGPPVVARQLKYECLTQTNQKVSYHYFKEHF
ncbi:NADPH oxidase [Paraphysoderma sedebokerense]|nr:NADPH oxidase [Paraphysoderma sedebokerense]